MTVTKKLLAPVLAIFASVAIFGPAVFAAEEEAPVQVLITNVDVWDGTSDSLMLKTDVLIEGNKIKQVAKGIKADGANVIDGKGYTVTPGLMDMHQHLILNGGTAAGNEWDAYVQGAHASRGAEYLLKQGFTTIRDIAGNTIGLKRAINAGLLPGPRIYTAGPALGPTGGHSDWNSPNAGPGAQDYQMKVQNTHVVDGRAEWLKAARWNMRNGADFLKIMAGGGVASVFDPIELNSPTPDEMRAAVEVAEEYGSYAGIHGYTDAAYNKSLDAGVKSFSHGFLITEPTVKRMKEMDVWWDFQPLGGYTILCGSAPDWFTPAMVKKGEQACAGTVRVSKLMRDYGIKTVTGSDMFGWDNWHNALVNVTTPVDIPDAGYTSLEAMKMATSNPGQMLRELVGPARNDFIEAKLGVIEEGAWADILIWKGNPTRDVKLILEESNLKLVMKGGNIYKNLLTTPAYEDVRDGLKIKGLPLSK
ncbi:MAG: amidohydrolase family protein [Gammaproteobacteria bacterium]|nr:amidohydrolase family protein [Gammaproteobacteria bacterium]